MAQLTPQDDYMKTALRLPRELHARIQEAASSSGRSMNAEIVARLDSSFTEAPPLEKRLAKLEHLMALEKVRAAQHQLQTYSFAQSLEQLLGLFDDSAIPDGHPFKKKLAAMRGMVNVIKPGMKEGLDEASEAFSGLIQMFETTPFPDDDADDHADQK